MHNRKTISFYQSALEKARKKAEDEKIQRKEESAIKAREKAESLLYTENSKVMQSIPNVFSSIQMIKGDKGEDGYTPIKGIDYFDGEDGYTPQYGIDYFDGKDGKDGKDGINGKDGKDGKDGKSIEGKPGKDADMKEVRVIVGDAVLRHEEKFDHSLLHDPKILGTKIVDESNAAPGKALMLNKDGELGYYSIPRGKQIVERNTSITGTGIRFPTQTGHSGQFLTTNGSDVSWSTVSGSGDVVGPASAVGNNFATYNGTTGKIIKDSGLNASSFASALGADDNYVTDAEKVIIGNTTGTNTGDQLVFKTIAVSGQSNVVADTTTDTLTLVAGSNITITTDASTDSITINGAAGGSGITRSVNSISTPTTAGSAASTDYIYLISAGTTLTMPTAVSNTNRYSLKNVDTSDVTIAFTGGQTADGSATLTLRQYVAVDLISDNTSWNVI